MKKPETNTEASKAVKAEKDKKVALANIDINNYASMFIVSNHSVSLSLSEVFVVNIVTERVSLRRKTRENLRETQAVKLHQTND